MHDVLGHGLIVLKAHRDWAGPALGIAACFEALVVIGALTPMTPLLVMVGAGIGAGVFSPWVVVWTMGGCGLGNWVSYEAGLLCRRADACPAWVPEAARIRAEKLFNHHGALAVVIGRFLGPTASILPYLAGWAAMPRRPFFLANLISSLIWPVTMAALGYIGARCFAQ